MIATTTSNARGVAVLGSGARLAAWSDASGVHAQQFDAAGALLGRTVTVAASGTFSSVAALPAGGYVVQYQTPRAVLVQAVNADSAPAGPAAVVRTQDQVALDYAQSANPVLVGGGGVYAFQDGSYAASYIVQHAATIPSDVPTALHAQKFDPSGRPVGSPALLRDTASADDMASAAAPGGRMIAASMLTHSSGAGLQGATVFDQELNPLFGVSLGQIGDRHIRPSVAGLANGSFIAMWTISALMPTAANANQVQAQIFTADRGSPSGARIISGLLTFPNATPGARVTALAGGGFLITGNGFALAFDASGQAISGSMQIQSGAVAATADGGFVVLAQVGSQLVAQQYGIAP